MAKVRRFKRTCGAAAVLTASTATLPTQESADAFNEAPTSDCSSIFNSAATFRYELKALTGPGPTVVPWNATTQGFFDDGAANWERLRNDANTAPAIDFVSDTTTSNRWQILRGLPGSTGDINGDQVLDGQSRACIGGPSGARVIQIASREDQPNTFRRTSVHETGHGLGLSHTGICDSRPVGGSSTDMYAFTSRWPDPPFCTGQQPVDSTSCGGPSTSPFPSADDYAALLYRRSGSGRTVTTNGGFESTQLTNTSEGQPWRGQYTVATATPFQGARYAELPNGASIRQQILIHNPTVAGSPPVSLATIRARYKSNGTSNAKIVIRKRHITNAVGDTCTAGEVPGPWNPNVWTSVGAATDVVTFQFNAGGNSSSWASLAPAPVTVASASNNSSSMMLEVEIINTTGGSPWIDNVSMQYDG